MAEIPKTYEPQKHEDEIYALWEKSGKFNPDNLKLPKNAKPYTIVLPPPNITDKLHLGHASTIAIEDLLIRFHRMKGFRALYLPGTDHAAIATQNVVEKKLLKEKGLTRHDLGRENFLKEVWKFLRVTQKTILNQARKMGGSFDWSREAFTLDTKRQKAVTRMFLEMYAEGLVYRGERIVNWCLRCKSTLADDEVEHQEQEAKLYTFRYWKDFPISISTTRPETKLGDTAVAVNPKDTRYKKYIGQEFAGFFCGVKLQVKIISDHGVEMDFGTGAVGVTPAHSMIDWQMAQKNNLKIVKVINEEGKIEPKLNFNIDGKIPTDALEAREMIVENLKKNNLLEKEEDIQNNLATCYRCSSAIEPIPSQQWFLAVDKKLKRLGGKSLKEKALEVAKKGKIKFHPARFTKRYLDWMTNLHDWCISRQIWFGHEFPVWYKKVKLTEENWTDELLNWGWDSYVENPKNFPNTIIKIFNTKTGQEIDLKKDYLMPIVPETEGEYEIRIVSSENISKVFGEDIKKYGFKQDSDTFDTWFSSGMWSFSTLGWPASVKTTAGKPNKIIKTGDLAKFHPTQVLETGYEILTLWVSRMIMMSLFTLGEIPFENVYLHGMILDQAGKKMSKSKGNGIDPLSMIEKFGTDAVRLSLLIGSTPGNDMRLSEEKIASYRNFVNKLWNIYRYCVKMDSNFILVEKITGKDLRSLADRWIVGELEKTIEEITNNLNEYKFSLAGEALEKFIWNDFADWYLEINKLENNPKVLGYVLDKILKLTHPFAPFVTEKIWQDFFSSKRLLLIEKWPKANKRLIEKKVQTEFVNLQQVVAKIRNIRTSYHIDPGKTIQAFAKKIENKAVLEKLARIKIETLSKNNQKGITVAGKKIKLILAITDLVDGEKEKSRLQKEIANLENLVSKINSLLKNKNFKKSAPKEVITMNEEKLQEYAKKLAVQKELLRDLG